jgi:hypothetical protein
MNLVAQVNMAICEAYVVYANTDHPIRRFLSCHQRVEQRLNKPTTT